jgi:ArsR family transcriptional regulator
MNAESKQLRKRKAEVIAAVGNPIRLAIVEFLAGGEQCVCDIADHVDAQRSNVSRHLGVLLQAGIVEQRKDGLKMMYTLKTPCILRFMDCIEAVLRQQAEESAEMLQNL